MDLLNTQVCVMKLDPLDSTLVWFRLYGELHKTSTNKPEYAVMLNMNESVTLNFSSKAIQDIFILEDMYTIVLK